MTFPILQYPADATRLRREARAIGPAEFGSEALESFAYRLGQTMLAARGMGLASTQVAEQPACHAWRMFAMVTSDQVVGIVCNPEIVSQSDFEIGPEGCLSFASVMEQIHAPSKVVFRFQGTDGTAHEVTATGLDARCVFHECGHLEGTLLIDRMSLMKRKLFLKAVQAQAFGTRVMVEKLGANHGD